MSPSGCLGGLEGCGLFLFVCLGPFEVFFACLCVGSLLFFYQIFFFSVSLGCLFFFSPGGFEFCAVDSWGVPLVFVLVVFASLIFICGDQSEPWICFL